MDNNLQAEFSIVNKRKMVEIPKPYIYQYSLVPFLTFSLMMKAFQVLQSGLSNNEQN